jgi:hypothetical protein
MKYEVRDLSVHRRGEIQSRLVVCLRYAQRNNAMTERDVYYLRTE